MESIAAKLLGEYGVIPVFVLICVILWFFLREIKKEVSGIKTSVTSSIQDLEQRSDEQDEKILKELSRLDNEVRYIQKEYLRKEDHYKDMGGWRTDVNRLENRMDSFFKRMLEWMN